MFIFLGKHLQRGFMKTQLHFFSFAWPKERTSRLKVSTVVNVILSPRKVNFTIDTKYLVIGFWKFCHILSQFCHLSNLKNRINPKIDFMNSHKYTSDIILTNPTLLFFYCFITLLITEASVTITNIFQFLSLVLIGWIQS